MRTALSLLLGFSVCLSSFGHTRMTVCRGAGGLEAILDNANAAGWASIVQGIDGLNRMIARGNLIADLDAIDDAWGARAQAREQAEDNATWAGTWARRDASFQAEFQRGLARDEARAGADASSPGLSYSQEWKYRPWETAFKTAGTVGEVGLQVAAIVVAPESLALRGVTFGVRAELAVEQGLMRGAAEGIAGDHIVLGLEAHGLERTAAQFGGRTLVRDLNWQTSLQTAIGNPGTRFSISLDGVNGASPYSPFMNSAQRGVSLGPIRDNLFNWEMGQLYQAGRHVDASFIQGGQNLANPFK